MAEAIYFENTSKPQIQNELSHVPEQDRKRMGNIIKSSLEVLSDLMLEYNQPAIVFSDFLTEHITEAFIRFNTDEDGQEIFNIGQVTFMFYQSSIGQNFPEFNGEIVEGIGFEATPVIETYQEESEYFVSQVIGGQVVLPESTKCFAHHCLEIYLPYNFTPYGKEFSQQ